MDDVDQQFELHPPTLDTASFSSNPTSAGDAKQERAGPIPMSMPSILRNSGSNNHLSYLLNRSTASSSSYPPRTKPRSGGGGSSKELGRRKQRRSENARLLSNPHAVRPTVKDYRLHSNEIRSTFPLSSAGGKKSASLPVPQNSKVGYSEPVYDAASANAGHFGKSLRDAQRVLKRLEIGAIGDDMVREGKAGELERFIWLVDREIRTWAGDQIHLFTPSPSSADRKQGRILLDDEFRFTSPPFSPSSSTEVKTVLLDEVQPGEEGGQLVEFQRTPNALVWLVRDPFLRLIVHCLARVSKCPSFSKDDASRPGLRFTWILNQNPLARRKRRGRRVSVSSSSLSVPNGPAVVAGVRGGLLETPPTTGFDSQTETESELGTETEEDSLAGSVVLVQPQRGGGARGGEDEEEGGGEEADGEEFEGEEAVVDTDEEEAEILRRVRRWAIDNHRQRKAEEQEEANGEPKVAASRKSGQVKVRKSTRMQDADATLTNGTIAEQDDDEQDDDARSHSDA